MQDELAEVLVVLFDYKHKLAPFLTTILNTEVRHHVYTIHLLVMYMYIVHTRELNVCLLISSFY